MRCSIGSVREQPTKLRASELGHLSAPTHSSLSRSRRKVIACRARPQPRQGQAGAQGVRSRAAIDDRDGGTLKQPAPNASNVWTYVIGKASAINPLTRMQFNLGCTRSGSSAQRSDSTCCSRTRARSQFGSLRINHSNLWQSWPSAVNKGTPASSCRQYPTGHPVNYNNSLPGD